MVVQHQLGKTYKEAVVISEVEIETAKKAALTYEWEGEDYTKDYPQYLTCKKTGNVVQKKNREDLFLWNTAGDKLLTITSDEYIIRDIIT